MNLLIHPAANLFPMISDVDFAQLKEDIRVHGLREPIWAWHDKRYDKDYLIDGRNRDRACRELKITPAVRWWDGNGSLIEFAMSLNFHRRMLTVSQRAIIAAKAMPMLEAEARKRQEASRAQPGQKIGNVVANLPPPTNSGKNTARDQAARLANVSGRSVQDAKIVLNGAPPKIIAAAQGGRVSVSDAASIAHLPAEQQVTALKKVLAGAARTLAEVVAGDDREAAIKRGLSKLRAAKEAFDSLDGKQARTVVRYIARALEEALKLAG